MLRPNDARCTRESEYMTAMITAALNKKKIFHQEIGLKFKEEASEVLHLEHSLVWC
jgi:hypothetical protein